MGRQRWFEVEGEGWARLASARPLGRLLLEALQNAFDARAEQVSVMLGPRELSVEDDVPEGVSDERLVYTLFLSDKPEDATRRGRMGRGLKELVAAMREARVETVGTTVVFDEAGRRTEPNTRVRGTRLVLRRTFTEEELRDAEALLKLAIPPKGTTLRVRGRMVRRPRLVLTLPSCELDTVRIEDGVERLTTASAPVSLYAPRRGETAHVLEMGIPIEAWDAPWHVDVAQRVPMGEGREGASERFKLRLKATLLESMIHAYLDRRDLRADWVHGVLGRVPLPNAVLEAYVSKVLPRASVLGGTSRANDRAAQLGAHVVDPRTMPQSAQAALARVLETADDFVRRRAAEFVGAEVEPDEVQRRFADAVRWLARRVAGHVIRVRFFARDPTDDGLLEDATTDPEARVLSFNVRGPLRFEDVLHAQTLGVVLHELAHLDAAEHDRRFVERLQHLAGATVRLLAEGGAKLAGALRSGDPDRAK